MGFLQMQPHARRPAKIPTPERLKNIALYYLIRYAASESSLRRVLENRVRRAKMLLPDFAADAAKQSEAALAIEQIIEAHKKTGAVNDDAFAGMKVAGLRRSGRSERFIRQKLAAKGLGKDAVTKALIEHDGEEDAAAAEMKAALAFVKRKRLGAFRDKAKAKEGDGKKDFATLARAGYGANIIRKILGLSLDHMPEDWG